MKIRKKFVSGIASSTDYPVSAVSGTPVISLEGTNRLDLEGCKSIIEISELKVMVDMGDYILSVVGDNMSLQNLTGDSMTMLGKINSINIEEVML